MVSNVAASPIPANLRQGAQPSSPHTPNRFLSSNFSSPGSGFRSEDGAVIIEVGARFLRAGFEGDHSPQCVVGFGPDESCRVGDYRNWAPDGRRKNFQIDSWGHEHELWRMDLTDVDLGLVQDKLERAIREVYKQYLLSDVGSARLILVLPSLMPHPLLSTLITTLFNRWKYTKICLLPSPTMAAVAAGLRSALVVDIGWSETIVTAIYEYREVQTQRSTRAMKSLIKEAGRSFVLPQEEGEETLPFDFDFAEELLTRMAWCKQEATQTDIGDDYSSAMGGNEEQVEIDWPIKSSSRLISLPFRLFSDTVERTFLAPESTSQVLDDEEHSLPLLVYESLLALPADCRAMCMSRIIFVGGGSSIPGLSQRVVREAAALMKLYGWSSVRGNRVEQRRGKLSKTTIGHVDKPDARFREPLPPGEDEVEAKLRKQRAREDGLPTMQGEFRQIESLGSWAGASLLASMKIHGLVEIDRDKFQHHGVAGARRDISLSGATQKTSNGPVLSKGARDRSSWTLAGWA